LNTNIQFTKNVNNTEIPFLDILVKIDTHHSIITDLYIKPTDTQQYLDFRSCHPKHTKCNIPFNLARRICTIVSNIELRDTRLQQLSLVLKERHYPSPLICRAIEEAKSIKLEELRKVKNKVHTKATIVVSTYNPNNPDIAKITKPLLPLLHTNDSFGQHIKQHGILNSKRQSPNLKNLLTKAAFRNEISDSALVQKCGNVRCKCCSQLLTGESVTVGRHTFKAGRTMTCLTSNLIYMLKCAGCNLFYIGETGDRLVDRVRVHRQQATVGSAIELPVHKHLKTCAPNANFKFLIFPFFKMPANSNKHQRLLKEKHFINKYEPVLNHL